MIYIDTGGTVREVFDWYLSNLTAYLKTATKDRGCLKLGLTWKEPNLQRRQSWTVENWSSKTKCMMRLGASEKIQTHCIMTLGHRTIRIPNPAV